MTYDIADFQHERDSSLAAKIMSSAAAQSIVGALHRNGLDRTYNYIYRACCPQLMPSNAPNIFELLSRVCRDFGLTTPPKIFVTRNYREMVSVRGLQEPFILFSSEYLRKLDDVTLLGVIAGQIAAIRCQHHRILYLTWGIGYASALIPAASLVIEPTINDWKRGRFFTYDKAFCLATGDQKLALRNVMINVVPAPIIDQMQYATAHDSFIDQAEHFVNGMALMQSGIKRAVSMLSEKDWLPERYLEIKNFFERRRAK